MNTVYLGYSFHYSPLTNYNCLVTDSAFSHIPVVKTLFSDLEPAEDSPDGFVSAIKVHVPLDQPSA